MAGLVAAMAAAAGCSGKSTSDAAGPRILVYTRTLGFRHDSISAALAAVRDMAGREHLGVVATEDPAQFRPDLLRGVSAVVFLHTTGEVLDPAGQDALQAYVRGGGGFLGIHSAADTGHGWPWYLDLLGAEFVRHPAIRAGDAGPRGCGPSRLGCPSGSLDADGRVVRLPRLAESARARCSSRSTSRATRAAAWEATTRWRGATSSRAAAPPTPPSAIRRKSWSEPLFLEHVRGALRWAAGLAPGDCGH